MAGVVRDRLTRWSACSACALAFYFAGGLAAIGVPYALLWGALAGMRR